MTDHMTPGQILERIAEEHLAIPTLRARHSGDLDFHVLAVWSIRKALHAAYLAGLKAGRSSTDP
jgi:Family of unknown function (DUF6900)